MNHKTRVLLGRIRSLTMRPGFIVGSILANCTSMLLAIIYMSSPATFAICFMGMVFLIADLKFLKAIISKSGQKPGSR